MDQGPSTQPFYLNDTETVTVDQIKTSDLRSLGDNVKLLAVIQNLSHDLVAKSENTYKQLDEIQRETEIKSVGVKNLINEFQMLADSQFIENRIYDADQTDSLPEEPTSRLTDEEMSPDQKILPIIHECISNSLKFIDENFNLEDKQMKQSAGSDDEEDYVKEALARAIECNPFNRSPLPAIIGSPAFFNQTIFNDGENPKMSTETTQNDNNSELSSDRNSVSSDEDSDLLFSAQAKSTSIQPGLIPPPPPMPNFKSMQDDDDEDDDGSLFPVDKTSNNQTRTMPQPPPLPKLKPIEESDDDDDNLFAPEKVIPVQPRTQPDKPPILSPKPNQPRVMPQLPPLPSHLKPIGASDSEDEADNLFSPEKSIPVQQPIKSDKPPVQSPKPYQSRMMPQLPPLPKRKPVDESDSDDDLFSHNQVTISTKPDPIQSKPIPSPSVRTNIKAANDDSDEEDSDLFQPPKVKPRNSINSLQESSKISSAIIDAIKQPKAKSDDIWDLDSDDDEELFPTNKPTTNQPQSLPQLPVLPQRKSSEESEEDNLFVEKKPIPVQSPNKNDKPISSVPEPSIVDQPQLTPLPKSKSLEDESDDDLFATKKPLSAQSQIPTKNKTLPQLKFVTESDSDSDDDLFSINNRPSAAKQPAIIHSLPTPTPEPSVLESKPKPVEENDTGDSDGTSKPPKVKPRKIIKIKKIEETPEPEKPETKSNKVWDLDSEDDELFLTNKTPVNQLQPSSQLPPLSRPKPSEESDNEEENLFSTERVVPAQPRTQPEPFVMPPKPDKPRALPQLPPLPPHIKRIGASDSEDENDNLFTEKTVPIQPQTEPEKPSLLAPKTDQPRALPQLPPLPSHLKAMDDSDDEDNLFSSQKSIPDQPQIQSDEPPLLGPGPEQPRIIPQSSPSTQLPRLDPVDESESDDDLFSFSKATTKTKSEPIQTHAAPSPSVRTNTKAANDDSDEEDSDDLFKPPKVKPRNSINFAQKPEETKKPSSEPFNTLEKKPEAKSNVWDFDSDDDDDLFKTIK